jgi:Calpain family cysteine protease
MPTHHSIYPSIGDGDESNSLRPTFSPTFSADPRLVGTTALASVQSAPETLMQALYLTEVKGAAAINVSDINQGQMGDCFLLSSIGEIALLQPSFISNMIHVSGNGTETVTLYEASDGMLPAWNTSSFKPVSETVTNVFPTNSVNSGASQDVVGGEKEIWPQVLEKAVATLDGGYSAIADGGSPLVAMEELTGRAVSYATPTNLTLASLLSDVKANDLIVMDTKSTGTLPSGLVDNHAYMFEGVTGSGASTTVHLGNPWGFDQPAPILFSQLSQGIAEVDIGHLS